MQATDSGPDCPGRLLEGPHGFWAFAPVPLPPNLPPSWKLAAAGILSEITGRRRHRLFAAKELIQAIEAPEPQR